MYKYSYCDFFCFMIWNGRNRSAKILTLLSFRHSSNADLSVPQNSHPCKDYRPNWRRIPCSWQSKSKIVTADCRGRGSGPQLRLSPLPWLQTGWTQSWLPPEQDPRFPRAWPDHRYASPETKRKVWSGLAKTICPRGVGPIRAEMKRLYGLIC